MVVVGNQNKETVDAFTLPNWTVSNYLSDFFIPLVIVELSALLMKVLPHSYF